jgi:hypothetical protein
MHFLDAWTELSLIDLARLLLAPVLLAVAAFTPGPRLARVAALGIAVTTVWLRELGGSPLLMTGWVALWLVVAWQAGHIGAGADRPLAPTRGVLEAGAVGLLLAGSVLALLIAAVARQDLAPEDGRRTSLGALLIGLGLLHLMLRRHVRRALVAFAAMGLGVQILDGVARDSQVPQMLPAAGNVLLGTTIAIALTARIAGIRERQADSAWVSDAHDLHD